MASKSAPLSLPLLRRCTTTRSLRTPPLFQTALPRLTSPHRNHISPSPTIFSRAAHSIPRPPPRKQTQPFRKSTKEPAQDTKETPQETSPNESFRPDPKGPAYYQLSFTCIPCGHRSHHNVSKQAYHHGSSLITCPGCRNRHVISDHLDIFGDRKITVEDLMRERGRLVKRGSLGEDGDIELWPEEVDAASLEGKEGGSKS